MLARLFSKLFKGRNPNSVPPLLYGKVVAGARGGALFREFGIEDSVMGRYDMLALHVFLITNRLKREQLALKYSDPQNAQLAANLSQEIFDLFIEDLERALREIGLGDSSVTKRKKRLVHSFYSLVEEMDDNLETKNQPAMVGVLRERYYPQVEELEGEAASKNLLTYVMRAKDHLANQDFENIVNAQLSWPDAEQLSEKS